MKPCVVIPAHNRQATTARCLQQLRDQGLFSWARVVVIDDGSSDGTAERVRRDFPQTDLLQGDGSLWWAGAMEKGMRWAMAESAPAIFWLNDDCYPRSNTLAALMAYAMAHDCIAVGQAVTPSGFRYGGFRKTSMWFERVVCEGSGAEPCDTFNGNCVCLPRAVVESIGYPDSRTLPHALADTDYGLRAKAAGIHAFVLGEALCDNEENPTSRSWLRDDVPLRDIWRYMTTPKGLHYGPAFLRFCLRHWGTWGLVVAGVPYARTLGIALLRLLVPRAVLQACFGRRTSALPS